MKVLKKIVIFIFLFLIYFFNCANNYANAVVCNISDSIFRLHVIANSDKAYDQQLKYKVRDNILNYMNSISGNTLSKDEIIKLTKDHLKEFEKIAQNTIYENGYNYNVTVEIGNFEFPTKTYGDISFPAGFYDSLRIKIGEAKGQNWWCVMFPPLCFIDVSSGIVPDDSKELLESRLSEDEYNLILDSSGETRFKFKIVEVLQNLKISGIFM